MRMKGVLAVAVAGGLWLGCSSSSSGPAPTMAGTWHVSLGTLNNGALTPASFDAVVRTAGDTFSVTIPTLTWNLGPVNYDSAPGFEVVQDSFVSFQEMIPGSAHVCDFVAITGRANAARDTIHSATVSLGDTDNTGVYICKPKAQGSATVTK